MRSAAAANWVSGRVTSRVTSGMTIASLLGTSVVFLALGWTDDMGKVAALSVGCVVAIAASIAGDTGLGAVGGDVLGCVSVGLDHDLAADALGGGDVAEEDEGGCV